MTSVLLVEKNGTIKSLKIKEFCEEDFYKKCGYKSPSNFKKQHTWKGKVEGTTYYISLFAKTDSRTAMGENKYEFPPPVDSVLKTNQVAGRIGADMNVLQPGLLQRRGHLLRFLEAGRPGRGGPFSSAAVGRHGLCASSLNSHGR